MKDNLSFVQQPQVKEPVKIETKSILRSKGFWLVVIIVVLSISSWIYDRLNPQTPAGVTCQPKQITRTVVNRDEYGQSYGSTQEVVNGTDCGGVFFPTPNPGDYNP